LSTFYLFGARAEADAPLQTWVILARSCSTAVASRRAVSDFMPFDQGACRPPSRGDGFVFRVNDPSAGSPTERFFQDPRGVPLELSSLCFQRPSSRSPAFRQGADYILSKDLCFTHHHLVCEQHPYLQAGLGLGCGLSIVACSPFLPYPRSLPRPLGVFRPQLGRRAFRNFPQFGDVALPSRGAD
jgi:hypothetical protein